MAQVQGEEIYLAHSGQEVDDNIDEVQAARGSEASLSARLAEIVGDFEADQQRQETEIGVVAAMGAKNLLNVTAQSTGIVTVNADGTLTVNGSSTSNTSVTLSSLWLKKGTYKLSSGQLLPTGVYLSIRISSGGETIQVRDSKTEVEFDVPVDMGIDRIWLFINANTPVDNLTIYPMIRRAEITDDSYAPYAPTNREIYETKAEKAEINNLLSNIDGSTTITAYAESLDSGHYVTFVANSSRPVDAPVAANMFIELYVYSVNVMLIRAFPISSTYENQFFQKIKSSGTWRGWIQFEGSPVASLQSVSPALMQAGRIDAELTDAENDEAETGEEDEER